MIEWVPAYESLYDNEKLGLRHTSRSVYMGICIKARKDKGDRVRLPRGRALLDGLHQLIGGERGEIEDAFRDDSGGLLYPKDPMIRVEGEDGLWSIVVLRRDRWALVANDDGASDAGGAALRKGGRPRLYGSDAERKRAERRRASGNLHADRPETRPETSPEASGNPSGNSGARFPDTGGVRGGVSDVLNSEKRKEKIPEERDARAGKCPETSPEASGNLHADRPETTSGNLPEIAGADALLVSVGRHPMLATLHDDRIWAMRAVGGAQAKACLASEVDEAIDAFVIDHAATAPSSGGALDDYVREHIGKYIKNAKTYSSRSKSKMMVAPMSADARIALDVFGEEWAKVKKKPFVMSAGDERVASDLVDRAKEHAARLKMHGRDIVRHWTTRYMKDTDQFLVDQGHLLRLLPSRLTTYGLPSAATKERPSEPKPAKAFVPPPSDLADFAQAGKS